VVRQIRIEKRFGKTERKSEPVKSIEKASRHDASKKVVRSGAGKANGQGTSKKRTDKARQKTAGKVLLEMRGLGES